MIDPRERLIRHWLRPKVECDLPGRLRLRFARHALLPEAAVPYLHYVEDVLKLLPGVQAVQLNPRIGTILVLYEPKTVSARQILRWVDIVVDTGLEIAREIGAEAVDEAELAGKVRARLVLRLPHM
ncbi:MAG: heavy-metal-associated domain-containing protein [Clostridia bacterium]|nr:heavy-metal-associated domain-containing protein [Clostridia bacterium]